MKIKRKNRFLTFCTSFLPGVTEMYIGYMKMGLSLLIAFFIFLGLAVFVELGILAMPSVIIWVYAFFHANNLAGWSQEELDQTEDEYLFGMEQFTSGKEQLEKYRKWIAFGLIIVGVLLLWNTVMGFISYYLPSFISDILWSLERAASRGILALFIIAAGVRMIKGKKVELFLEEGRHTDGREEDH